MVLSEFGEKIHVQGVRLCPLCVPAYLWIALIALLGEVLLCCTTCLVSLVSCSTHVVWCVLSSVTFVPTICLLLCLCLHVSASPYRFVVMKLFASCCASTSSFSLEFGLLRSFRCCMVWRFWCLPSFLSVLPSRFVVTQLFVSVVRCRHFHQCDFCFWVFLNYFSVQHCDSMR